MMHLKKLLILILVGITFSCAHSQKNTIVKIHTSLGSIKIMLYNETPLHRDNFIKLANEHYFDSLLFHRVINNFMIQGGDPESRNAQPGAMLGNGGPKYTLPAEINYPKFFHKKGALAAARQSDQVNPQKESSGSQFYIVHGDVLPADKMDQIMANLNQKKKQQAGYNAITQYSDSLNYYMGVRDSVKFVTLRQKAIAAAEAAAAAEPDFVLPDHIKTIYQTMGGTPHLDGEYTVFGEVIEGLDIIDKIAALPTDANNRPLQDIKMWVEVVK